MGGTSVWGYVALAATILGFAYGFWRQNRKPKKNTKKESAESAKKQALVKDIDDAENEE